MSRRNNLRLCGHESCAGHHEPIGNVRIPTSDEQRELAELQGALPGDQFGAAEALTRITPVCSSEVRALVSRIMATLHGHHKDHRDAAGATGWQTCPHPICAARRADIEEVLG